MPFNTEAEKKEITKIRGKFRVPGLLDETVVVEVPQGTSLYTILEFVKNTVLDKLQPGYIFVKSCWINSNTFYYNFQYYKVEYILEGVVL